MSLEKLCHELELSQLQTIKELGFKPESLKITRLRSNDPTLSTLRKYVKEMGAELVIGARLRNGKTFTFEW